MSSDFMVREAPWVIFGAGGHALVVADIIWSRGAQIGALFSPVKPPAESPFAEVPFYSDDGLIEKFDPSSIVITVAIGMRPFSDTRKSIISELRKKKFFLSNVVSPRAIISDLATLGEGVQIMPGAVINAGAIIGDYSIINSNAVIEHDTIIGSNCHIAPGAVICGGVNINNDVFVGAGSVVRETVVLGKGVVIGATSFVAKDVPAHMVVRNQVVSHLVPKDRDDL